MGLRPTKDENGADELWVGGPGLASETWVFRLGFICREKPRSQSETCATHPKSGGRSFISTERTRISYFALLATTRCAALRRESRMRFINATVLDRKSGGASWRDLRFLFSRPHEMF
jgi:hypothetical protein